MNFALLIVLSYLSQLKAIEGEPTSESSPHMVAIFHKQKYICIGSLITMDLVITSADCLKNCEINDIVVKAGLEYVTDQGESRQPRCKINPEIDLNIIAIKLDSPFIENDRIKSIPLCKTELSAGTKIHVSAWGSEVLFIGRFQTIVASIMEKPSVPKHMVYVRVDRSDTISSYPGQPGVLEGQLCAVGTAESCNWVICYGKLFVNANNDTVLNFFEEIMAEKELPSECCDSVNTIIAKISNQLTDIKINH